MVTPTSTPGRPRAVIVPYRIEPLAEVRSPSGLSTAAMRQQADARCIEALQTAIGHLAADMRVAGVRTPSLQSEPLLAAKALRQAIEADGDRDPTTQRLRSVAELLHSIAETLLQARSAHRDERILATIQAAATGPLGTLTGPGSKCCKILLSMKEEQALLKMVTDWSRLEADGVTRTSIFFQSPDTLRQLRATRGLDPASCELVIIGAGPAGIAAAVTAAEAGLDTICFEGGYIAQSMSDARAGSVHSMRTNQLNSSLFRPGIAPPHMVERYGMPAIMRQAGLRSLGVEGRDAVTAASGYRFPSDLPHHDTTDPSVPVSRAEAYAYFQELAQSAHASGNAIFLEQSPVEEVIFDHSRQRFTIRSGVGHKIETKHLIVAVGFVGTEGQFSRMLPELQSLASENPGRLALIENEHDLAAACAHLAPNPSRPSSTGEASPLFAIAEACLGHTEISEHITSLPNGTKCAVVGSGESAAKSTLRMLELNHGIKVDLFVSSPLEPSQLQVPFFGTSPDPVLRGVKDLEFARHTVALWRKDFGTPIVPSTMVALLEAVQSGRLQIFELGERLSGACASFELSGSDKLSLELRVRPDAHRILTRLEDQLVSWRDAGILPHSAPLGTFDAKGAVLGRYDGPIVVAAGYDRAALREENPLLRSLLEQGLLETSGSDFKVDNSGLFSSRCSQLSLLGAGNIVSFADSAFMGAGARALYTVTAISRALGRSPSWDLNEALPPAPHAAALQDRYSERFPGNPFLADLARRRSGGTPLSPAEKLVLDRGESFADRINSRLRSTGLT